MNGVLKRFANGFTRNLQTILQALVFSVIIWFIISIQIFPDVSIHIENIPVRYEVTSFMLEEDLMINNYDTAAVTAQVNGKRYQITDLTADDFTAVCDLSDVHSSGEHIVPIYVYPNTDKECSITNSDLHATVSVIKMVSKEIPVEPGTSGLSIAEGMQILGDVTVTPDTLTVTGEESVVNSIDHVVANAYYQDGELDHSAGLTAEPLFITRTGSAVKDPEITYLNTDFTVSVPVYKLKTLPVQVKFTGSASSSGFNADDLDYSLSLEEITIASPDSSIDNLAAIDIGEISLSALSLKDLQGGVTLPVELPEGYLNISGNKSITVNFPDADEFGQLGFTVPSEQFTIINKPTNFDVRTLTKELTVNVVGYSNYIQEMTSSDIYATINLLGMELSEGSKSVSVTFRLAGRDVNAWVTGEGYKVELLITAATEDIEGEPEDAKNE